MYSSNVLAAGKIFLSVRPRFFKLFENILYVAPPPPPPLLPFAIFESLLRANDDVLDNDNNAGGERDVEVVTVDVLAELATVTRVIVFDNVVVNAGITFGCDEITFDTEFPYVLICVCAMPIDGAVDETAAVVDANVDVVGFVARLLLFDTGIVVDIAFKFCTVDFPAVVVDTVNLIRFSLLLLLIALSVCVVNVASFDIFHYILLCLQTVEFPRIQFE